MFSDKYHTPLSHLLHSRATDGRIDARGKRHFHFITGQKSTKSNKSACQQYSPPDTITNIWQRLESISSVYPTPSPSTTNTKRCHSTCPANSSHGYWTKDHATNSIKFQSRTHIQLTPSFIIVVKKHEKCKYLNHIWNKRLTNFCRWLHWTIPPVHNGFLTNTTNEKRKTKYTHKCLPGTKYHSQNWSVKITNTAL